VPVILRLARNADKTQTRHRKSIPYEITLGGADVYDSSGTSSAEGVAQGANLGEGQGVPPSRAKRNFSEYTHTPRILNRGNVQTPPCKLASFTTDDGELLTRSSERDLK
jgi:hypothetical protein